MSVVVKVDSSQMSAALRAYYPTTKKSLAEIINQRTLNVAGRAFDIIPPRDVVAKREEIQAYLRQPLSQKIRPAKTGRARFLKAGTKNQQLQRVHLIVQSRRARAGKKGLWGRGMTRVSGRFVQTAQVSVGFVKSVFIPIIRALNPLVPFKFPFAKTEHIARWPGSAGHGIAKAAVQGWNPTARFEVALRVESRGDARVTEILTSAVQQAFNDEAGELRRHVEEKMQKEANRINARAA